MTLFRYNSFRQSTRNIPNLTQFEISKHHGGVRFCENLHAKCYLNETAAIITSMNLYEFSQVNNNEMGILVDRLTDTECFVEAEKEAQRIVRISVIQKPRKVLPNLAIIEAHESPTPMKPTGRPEDLYEKLTTAKLAKVCDSKATELLEYFTAKAYLEIRDGKHFLTDRGKEKGAEVRFSKSGVYFLWPKVLLKKFREPKPSELETVPPKG